MIIPLSIRAGQLLVITIFCIYVFYNIYLRVCSRSVVDSIYMSTMNQTLNGGGGLDTRSETEKIIVAVQCILAFFVSTGLVIISFNM